MRTRKLCRRTFSDRSTPINEYRRGLFPFWEDVLGGFFVYRAAILDRFFVKVMSYEMEHSFLRNDLD